MVDLTVFDLQKFSLHDGPGIRTTVFLKGCPLDCMWCHNPESRKKAHQLAFLEKNCTLCGKCQEVCPQGVHLVSAAEGHQIDFDKCDQCGLCVAACPNHALKIYGKRMSSDAILKTVMQDWDFYQRSGGGLTVSGGEPMLQFHGLQDLLKGAKERGLHVCLDTSGLASQDKYAAIADLVDVFLFDYKITAPEDHKRYTGQENNLILRNLDYLCSRGSHVILRCPIIPGINDNDEHYRSIAELSRKYPQIEQVNLMMYHDMAKGKVAEIGESYRLPDVKTILPEVARAIYSKVESFGCLRLQES